MSQQRDLQEFRSTLKVAKRELSRGHPRGAEVQLLRAYELASYLPARQRSAKHAFVLHRLAEASALLGEVTKARARFNHALKLVDHRDKIAHARLLRDFGNFERIHGKRGRGLSLVSEALEILESIDIRNGRAKVELIVTEGFLARFDLDDPAKRDEALQRLRWVASQLHGYKKKAYELANLKCLISELPIYSVERLGHLQRAIRLSLKLGNLPMAAELTSLLGGSPSRSIYSLVVRAFG